MYISPCVQIQSIINVKLDEIERHGHKLQWKWCYPVISI